MLGTLERHGTRPVADGGQTPMGKTTPSVVAAFVSTARMERDCIRLYAQTHPEVRAAAILPGGKELLQQLRGGLCPQVLVLDVLLNDMGLLSLLEEIRALHLNPRPVLLLSVPVPERTAARRAMQAFGDCEVILKPYSLKELFDQIYLLGAGAEQYHLYRIRGCCRRYLQKMHADPAMSGCDYLEQMLLYALASDRPMTVAALYQLVARDNNTQEGSVAAAVVRLSQKMHRQNTGFYRQLCVRCGLPEDAVLPNGKLLKGMWELLRQEVL